MINLKGKNGNVYIYVIAILALLAIVVTAIYIYKPKKLNHPEFNDIKINYFVLDQDGKQGVVDRNGKMIINPEYIQVVIPDASKPVFAVLDAERKVKYLNEKSEEIFKQYSDVQLVGGDTKTLSEFRPVLKIKKNEKYGLINMEGQIIVEPIYEEISTIERDIHSYKVKKAGKYGLLSYEGIKILNEEYSDIESANTTIWEKKEVPNGYKISKEDKNGKKEGFADIDGNILVPVKYESVEKVEKEGKDYHIIIQSNGKKGLYKNKRMVLKPEFQEIAYTTKTIVAKKQDKYGLYTFEGKELVNPRFTGYTILDEYVAFKENDKEYAFNKEGKAIGKGEYKYVSSIPQKGYLIVENFSGERSVLINGEEKKEGFLDITYLSEDIFAYLKDGKYGIINILTGKKIENKYSYIANYGDTNIIQTIGDKGSEYYNTELEMILSENKNNGIIELDNGIIVVKDQKTRTYYEKNGNKIEDIKSKNMVAYPVYGNNGKWGYEDKNGNIKMDPKYDEVTEFNKYGFAAVKLGDKWGVINDKFEVVEEPKYPFTEKFVPTWVGKYILDEELYNTVFLQD